MGCPKKGPGFGPARGPVVCPYSPHRPPVGLRGGGIGWGSKQDLPCIALVGGTGRGTGRSGPSLPLPVLFNTHTIMDYSRSRRGLVQYFGEGGVLSRLVFTPSHLLISLSYHLFGWSFHLFPRKWRPSFCSPAGVSSGIPPPRVRGSET